MVTEAKDTDGSPRRCSAPKALKPDGNNKLAVKTKRLAVKTKRSAEALKKNLLRRKQINTDTR